MKINKNHELKSSSLLVLLGSVVGSLVIIATPWNRSMNEGKSEKTLHRAEIVGYQIVELYREAAKAQNNPSPKRGPASILPAAGDLRKTGTMGQDPWGQAYHYRILSTDQNKLRILVWSIGPNQNVDSGVLDDEDAQIEAQPRFAGDDMGIVMMIPVE